MKLNNFEGDCYPGVQLKKGAHSHQYVAGIGLYGTESRSKKIVGQVTPKRR